MEEFDLVKSFDELLKRNDPPNGPTLTNTTEAPNGPTVTSTTEAPNGPPLTNTTEASNGPTLTNTTEASNGHTLTNTTEARNGPTLTNMSEAPNPISLDSILPRLPPEGQAWLNGLNRYCRWALEHDLRTAGPDLFVEYWESLRDTLQKLERDLGPSDNWK
jgi:hypothetical protein